VLGTFGVVKISGQCRSPAAIEFLTQTQIRGAMAVENALDLGSFERAERQEAQERKGKSCIRRLKSAAK